MASKNQDSLDYKEAVDHLIVNGNPESNHNHSQTHISHGHGNSNDHARDKKPKNWKLVEDPALKKGGSHPAASGKVYRYEGVIGVRLFSFKDNQFKFWSFICRKMDMFQFRLKILDQRSH